MRARPHGDVLSALRNLGENQAHETDSAPAKPGLTAQRRINPIYELIRSYGEIMANRLKILWRGEIKLAKSFWIFGIFIPLFFVSLIILIQRNLRPETWASPNSIFYANVLLLLIYIFYSVFILVTIWRSANNRKGSKIFSFFAKLASIIAVLWLGVNLGLFFIVMTVCAPILQSKINYVPDNISFPTAEIQSNTFYFDQFKQCELCHPWIETT